MWSIPSGRLLTWCPQGGTVLANGEDENTMKALEGKEGVLTFGLETGNFHAKNLTWDHGFPTFDLVWDEKPMAHITLQVPGEHNVEGRHRRRCCVLDPGDSRQCHCPGAEGFRGVNRRFEFKG